MADGGVPTTELGEVAGAEAVLANYEGTTGLLTTSALGTLLAASGPLADALGLKADVTTTDALGNRVTSLETIVTSGAVWMDPVDLLADSDITLSGEQTIDGTLTSTSRVAVIGKTDKSLNGVYDTSSGAWSRVAEMDAADEINLSTTFVNGGVTYGGETWKFVVADPDTFILGTDDIGAKKVGDAQSVLDYVNSQIGGKLEASNNLSDLGDPEVARGNLDVPSNAEFAALDSKFDGEGYERSGAAWAIVHEDGKRSLWVDNAGRIYFGDVDVTDAIDGTLQTQFDTLEARQAQNTGFLCIGDSLTEGSGASSTSFSWPAQLSDLYSDARATANRGVGGQSSDQIAGRFGAEAVLVEVDGAEIPASGAVTVNSITPNITYYAGGSKSWPGWIGGIHGTLSASSFTRTTSGTAKAVLATDYFVPDVSAVWLRIWLMWLGRNDGWSSNDGTALLARYERMVEAIPTTQKRFLLLDVLNNAAETSGTAAHTNIVAFNAALMQRFPKNVIPIRKMLIEQGLARAGITPTAQDLTDIANDVIPTSLRADSTHLNNTGYGVVAEIIKDYIDFMEASQWL
ncbi:MULTISPECIES: SGNH/GDSL hydrolase family protein [Salipiger]|jgi:lysophospholipase L1-like esterase|uniref:Phage tail fiber protein n=1 Tax=Salipiger profundus TaxID=1229727 RepID=A0A1U7CZQ2_9RHOB|nr:MULTISPECIES: SGNH/GDSL hydrolase family protein [Salipiger]APX21315.1 Phage tail fiber protein [Salipiger profundus]GGA03318.1 hypothetical protein GCM10011326_13360 [Salipiger profundus]